MNRRSFLTGAVGVALATPAAATVNSGASPMLRSTLHAAELGVSPRKANDQSRGIQQLLNIASDDDRPVFLPAGTYMVSQLRLPARVRLSGVAGATRLVFGRGTHMIEGERCELVSISDLIIDGAGGSLADHVPAILHIAESRHVAIHNCVIEGSARCGIALERSGGTISRTIVRNARDSGIRAVESTNLILSDNAVEDCGNGGIVILRYAAGDDGTLVTGNRIARIGAADLGEGRNGCGISIFRAHGVIAANNRITGAASSGISASAANNVQITANQCRNCGSSGIVTGRSSEASVISANIVETAPSGINVSNSGQGGRMSVVSGNILRDLTRTDPDDGAMTGIGIAVDTEATVSGNVVDGAARAGMRIGWGPSLRDVAATGNVIRGAPVGIAVSVVEGAGAAVISDNLIAGATRGAVVGMRWNEPASGDLAAAGALPYPHLTVERNRGA